MLRLYFVALYQLDRVEERRLYLSLLKYGPEFIYDFAKSSIAQNAVAYSLLTYLCVSYLHQFMNAFAAQRADRYYGQTQPLR